MVSTMFKGLNQANLLQLELQDCKRILVKDEVKMIFKACNAFWHHPGQKNPTALHAILTNGKHSNVYVNCPQVLQRSNLCQIMAMQLVFNIACAQTKTATVSSNCHALLRR